MAVNTTYPPRDPRPNILVENISQEIDKISQYWPTGRDIPPAIKPLYLQKCSLFHFPARSVKSEYFTLFPLIYK